LVFQKQDDVFSQKHPRVDLRVNLTLDLHLKLTRPELLQLN